MIRHPLTYAIHAALAAGLMLPLAHAQSPAAAAAAEDGEARVLDAVTVTARHREESLQDVPIAVTAFTPEALDTLDVGDLSDLDAHVPNLTLYAARGSNTTMTVFMRGVGQADPLWGVDPGVGLYLDGVYIARPQGALLDVFDVGRIEVLRGPQGTLYGKNTIGGAIKYISNPLPTRTQARAELTLGNFSQRNLKASIGSPIGESVRFRLAAASLQRDGFGENLTQGTPLTDQDTLAARFSIGLFAGEGFDAVFSIDHLEDASAPRGAQMLTANLFAPGFAPLADRYDARNGMAPVNNTTLDGMALTMTWTRDNWLLTSITAQRESATETNLDFDTLPNIIADVAASYHDEQFSQELRLNHDAGGRSRGVLGLYWFDGTAGGWVRNNFFNLAFGDTQGTVDTRSIAAFADWTWDLGERTELSAGARWTSEEKTADVLNRGFSNATFTIPIATVADFEDSVSFENVSPRFAINHELSEDLMLYGSFSRGFKSGGFNIRANAVAVPRSARPFEDETVDSFELGAKATLLGGRAFVNAALFHNVYENIQLSVFSSFIDANGVAQFFGDFTNAGEGTIQGAEIEYQFLPSDRWLISGNLAWLDARYDEFIDRGVNIADRQRFTNAPEFSGAINLEYRQPLGDAGELAFRTSFSYQSEVWPTTDLSPLIRQPGYGLWGAGLIWRSGGPWTVSLQGSNLSDESYRVTGFNIPALGVHTGFYGPPRQWALNLRYDFF